MGTYLTQNDQDSVNELVELGEVEDIHPEEEGALVDVLTTRIAEKVLGSLLEAVVLDGRDADDEA
jgi:hypothetical protein